VTVTEERDQLIHRIGAAKREIGRVLVHNRTMPLLASNLTMQQLRTVVLLSSLRSASGQDLAHNLGVGLGTVTGIVDRLIGHGLVTRREDPDDRRVRRVELTDLGLTLIDDLGNAGMDGFLHLLRHLDLDTLRLLEDVLGKILEVAEAHQEELTTPLPRQKVG
jgi:DNA-binding MarR family transcriptional regulator